MTTSPTSKKRQGNAVIIRGYLKAALQYPWLLAFLVAGSVAVELASLASPLYIKELIDSLAVESPSDAIVAGLFATLGLYAFVRFLRWVAGRVQMISLVYLESKAIVDLHEKAYAYLIGHSHGFFVSNFTGSLQRRVGRYAYSFASILEVFVFNFLSLAIFSVGVIIVLAQRSIWLGIGLIAWVVVALYLQILVAKLRHPLRLERAKAETRLSGVVSDSISNQPTVAQFAARRREEEAVGEALDGWYAAAMRTNIADIWIWGIQGLLAVIVDVALLFAAVYLWQQGQITVGDFVLIQVYVLGLIEGMWGIGNSLRRLYASFADAQEMVDIFDTPYDIQDRPDARKLEVASGAVELSHVSFAFAESNPVLTDVSLSIPAKQKIALVGPSGAGKSTITKLLLRLYDVSSGSIQVDGQDIRDVTQDSLRENISFVPQDPTLFHRSLMDNIRYGKPDATDEEVIEAARKARCHEFIAKLPEGYGTHVGERGVKLSGGERQRVAIARAILKDAPILILDEATSALDSESEHLIQDALKVLMEGKTVIVIAHRLSTIMTMDRIIVVEDGRIVADGTHQELLNQDGGLYQKLWSIQAGSFVADT